MAELLGLGALITGLDNDSLSASVSAVQHDNNLSSLDAAKNIEHKTSFQSTFKHFNMCQK
jgi:hypothetical protein